MTTQYYTASSLDGFIADADNSLSWLFQFGETPEVGAEYETFVNGIGALAMGSTTYEWMLTEAGLLDDPRRWPYPVPTWVFSSRVLPPVEGADVRFVSGDVRPVHAEMAAAAAGKNIWLVGGGDLVGQFHDHGLLDEVILGLAPVTLGAGAPVLPRAITTPPLRLVEVKAADGVFAMLRYAVQH